MASAMEVMQIEVEVIDDLIIVDGKALVVLLHVISIKILN